MLDILRERRSIRRYEDREIEAEKIELIKEAALRPPSSRGGIKQISTENGKQELELVDLPLLLHALAAPSTLSVNHCEGIFC